MPDKYRWETTLKKVVEFVRHDAEISVDLDGKRSQFVVKPGCASNQEAEAVAAAFCEELQRKIDELVRKETSGLKQARE